MMILAVIHGFASTSFNKANAIRDIAGDKAQVVGIEYDSMAPERNYEEICEQIRALLSEKVEVVVVGASLGGLFGSNCAHALGLRAILINPVINTEWQFGRYAGAKVFNYRTMKEDITLDELFLSQIRKFKPQIPVKNTLVLIGKEDETVPPKDVEGFFAGKAKLCMKDTDHRFDLSMAQKEILEFLFGEKNEQAIR